MVVVGAAISHTTPRLDWWLQIHTVTSCVISKVSLQARHNWTAVGGFMLIKVIIKVIMKNW